QPDPVAPSDNVWSRPRECRDACLIPSVPFFSSGAGVGGVVDLGQVLVVQVGVDLGGGDVGVAEQFLHAAQVARGLEHVAGEGVAQQVRMHALEQALALGELAQAQLHGARGDRSVDRKSVV